MMPIPQSLTVGGVERVGMLTASSLTISEELNARDTATFELFDRTGTVHVGPGQVVQILDATELVFAGLIFSNKARRRSGASRIRHALTCVDFNQLADRHVVAEVYDNLTMKAIVENVLLDHLTTDGVTLDPDFPDGPIIEHIPFNYVSCAQVFDELSTLTGYFWNITDEKVLQFIDRSTMRAPVDLASGNGVFQADTVEIDRSLEQYRNEQYIRGGLTITDAVQVDESLGDGKRTTFQTALPIALPGGVMPVVKVNGGVKTVGIRQNDTGKDWYVQENSNEVSQDSAGTKLTSSDTFRVEYSGYFPLIGAARNPGAVLERQTVEGGSGLYQRVEDREEIDRAEGARERAESLLRRFGRIDHTITGTTLLRGFHPGQVVNVHLPEHQIHHLDCIIAAVEYREVALTRWHYTLTIVSGEAVEGWSAFWKKIAAAGRKHVIRPNEVVNLIRLFPEAATIAEVFAAPVSTAAAIGKVGTAKVGFGVVG